MRNIKLLLLVFCILAGPFSSQAGYMEQRADELWKQVTLKKQPGEQVAILLKIADDYYIALLDGKTDSTFEIAVETARSANDEALEVDVYKKYFERDEFLNRPLAERYAARLQSIANSRNNTNWLFFAYRAVAKLNLDYRNNQQALLSANRAYQFVSAGSDDRLRCFGLILLGQCSEAMNLKIEAFRDYSEALSVASRAEDSDLIFSCYHSLSSYYRLIGNYDKAFYYKRLQLNSFATALESDSVKLMRLKDELAFIYYKSGNSAPAVRITQSVIAFAESKGCTRLRSEAFTAYRGYLINNNDFKGLYELYVVQNPGELLSLATKDPALYSRIYAFIEEASGKIDSAATYFNIAQKYMESRERNKIKLSNFYMRYGQFCLRNGRFDTAKSKFTIALSDAASVSYYPFVIESAHYLDSINAFQNNFGEAYKYVKIFKTYSDSQSTALKEDDLLRIEIANEESQRKMMEEREERQTERRHSIQYIGIIIVITTFFVVLAMLGSFRVPRYVIKLNGFFSFLLLFEFIVMITDSKVEALTHEEPYKILAFKIVIIAILTPIHHWIEHRVIEFLYEHKLLETTRLRLRHVFSKKRPVKEKEHSE